jgi:1-acyl-sn-glycerol-3-phosphate acyltransferase
MEQGDPELTRSERLALRLGRLCNENVLPKRLQQAWLENVSRHWIRTTVSRRSLVEGMDILMNLDPDRGVVVAANHRSFFDQWVAMLAIKDVKVPWAKDLFFPVRSNFFYDSALGVIINFFVGGGVMYPPIYRDRSKDALNKDALERLRRVLERPGVLVGVHPEGTRGKGPDPYEMLPAQPGIGEIILKGKPIVIPLFINGLSNDIVSDTRFNYTDEARRQNPCILVFGEPVDYSEYANKKPRVALYKRTSDKVLAAIVELTETEKQLRAACNNGDIPDDDHRWLPNLKHHY